MQLLSEIQKAYKKLQEELDELKIEIVHKDGVIEKLSKIAQSQALLIATFRISATRCEVTYASRPLAEHQPSKSSMNDTSTIESLKQILSMYQTDLLQANARIKDYEDTIHSIESKAKSEVENKMQSVSTNEEKLKIELKDLHHRFACFKEDVTREFDVREQLEKRQQMLIKGLQEELKAAKFVMKNPRLRFRLQEMMKEEPPRTPSMSTSMRNSRLGSQEDPPRSRIGSQEDLPKVSRLEYESPVKTKARTRSTTHSPESSLLNISMRAQPKYKILQ
mmetsp:Transcript_27493/g.49504  ORF Transcript_27493/g.49504 Transcript_27493/m.49504 type:complete len:278 (-) Transcript_27493:31-864(-)